MFVFNDEGGNKIVKKKIAIIEDDINLLQLLKTVLKEEGYEVYGATTGIDLVNQLVNNKPDLILLDLMLPLVPGEKVINAFLQKDLLTDVPVIIISGKEEKETKKAAKEIGAVAYLKKPINNKELIELVKKYTE